MTKTELLESYKGLPHFNFISLVKEGGLSEDQKERVSEILSGQDQILKDIPWKKQGA